MTKKKAERFPILAYGFLIRETEFEEWFDYLVDILIQDKKIKNESDVNSSLVKVAKLFGVDSKLEVMALEAICFKKFKDNHTEKEGMFIFVNDWDFDETLSTIEKKNIVHDVFLKLQLNMKISTIFDIVEF